MGGEGSGKPKAEMIKLDGTQIDLHGNATQSDFFNFLKLPAEHFVNLEKTMTTEQALAFRNHISRMKVGTSAMMPMLCGALACPVQQCPFHLTKSWPAGEQCPIESNLIAAWTKSYIEDIGVEPDNRTEMILINKLVECDMIDYRANIGLSKDQDGWTLIKTDIMETERGTQEMTSSHPLLEIKDRNHATRMKVLESFNATRREKAKKAAMLKQREDGDIGAHWADMKDFINKFEKQKNQSSMAQIKQDAKDIANSSFVEADWETTDE